MYFKINHQDPATPLEATIVAALREMKAHRQGTRMHYGYTAVWRRILGFASKRGMREMSAELGKSFLRSERVNEAPRRRNPARYLGEARRGVRSLLYFAQRGVWDPQRASRLHLMLPILDSAAAKTSLESTIVSALDAMKSQSYPDCTRGRYSLIWRHLLKFAARQNRSELSAELCRDFLSYYRASAGFSGIPLRTRMVLARRAIRSLKYFAGNGVWKPYHPRKNSPVLPAKFADDLRTYLGYLRDDRGASRETLRFRRGYLEEFLTFLSAQGVRDWRNVTAARISAFWATKTHLRAASLRGVSCALRGFLRFLFVKGRIERDFFTDLPRFQSFADQSIPAAWPAGSVEALLQSVGRDSVQGKRDYAVLMLASRLGMRAEDIRMLRLESFHWEDARIEYVQSKTGNTIALPLTEEVGSALIDYLLNGRPASPHREVFLRLRAPAGPMTCSVRHILKKYRQHLPVPLPLGHMGMHSLRHTLARQLLAHDTPLQTIAGVLGHVSLRATCMYAKVDVSQLRTAALDPEEVSHA